MKEPAEFLKTGEENGLFALFYEKIFRGEIPAFSALCEYAAPVLKDSRARPVILRAFELIRRLYWGFFAAMDPKKHRRLWKEIVIPGGDFPGAGDLKRTLSISNLYVAMLDIHGYTRFCQESRKNLSMMHTLDRAINHEISAISTACQAVSRRERGDEIVIVAASASDALTATLAIIDYFEKTGVVQDPAINTKREGDAVYLPAFKISAGITGGNTSSPLIITEQGDLSGFLLNSGARLQVRANELSPAESRVMVTKQVQMNFIKENSSGETCPLFRNGTVYFLDTGVIEFKGVLLPACEAVYRPTERYKEQFAPELANLFAATGDNLWEQKIPVSLAELLAKAAESMPEFSFVPEPPVAGIKNATNGTVRKLCQDLIKCWTGGEDFIEALSVFRTLLAVVEAVPGFDRLILDYARGIYRRYAALLEEYRQALDQEVEQNAAAVFPPDQQKTWTVSRNAAKLYGTLRIQGHKNLPSAKKKAIWYSLIKANQDKMEMVLYSGKK